MWFVHYFAIIIFTNSTEVKANHCEWMKTVEKVNSPSLHQKQK